MIFAATVRYAQEVFGLLPNHRRRHHRRNSRQERDNIIQKFKNRETKFLVNVCFNHRFWCTHVDDRYRPTESISLYQQTIGRGPRLPGKNECLILDYAEIATISINQK